MRICAAINADFAGAPFRKDTLSNRGLFEGAVSGLCSKKGLNVAFPLAGLWEIELVVLSGLTRRPMVREIVT